MNSQTFPAKQFKAIINATFPDYRRKEVIVEAMEAVTFCGLNWSGGSKTVYRACTIDGKPLPSRVDMGMPAPWDNPFEGLKVQIPEGCVIVEGGWFMGKTCRLRIYCNPQNMPKLLEMK